jgi:hypothetical protein
VDNEVLCGVAHATELRFVFDTFQYPVDPRDHFVAKMIGTYWGNFAKTGNPNTASSDGAGANVTGEATSASSLAGAGATPVFWPKYTLTGDAHLELNDPPTAATGLANATCNFWDSLPAQDGYPH